MFVEQMLPRARERLATIRAAAPVTEAANMMSKPHIELLVVCGPDGVMVGVLTKTDIVGHIGQCLGAGYSAAVGTIMTPAVISSQPEKALELIWTVITGRGLQRVTVLDKNNKLVGIIYARDALQCLLGDVEHDEALHRDYVMNVGYQ